MTKAAACHPCPEMTYFEAALRRIEALREVAHISPRLAIVGAWSEVECMFQEIIPEELLARWEAAERARVESRGLAPPRYPRTTVARRAIERFLLDNVALREFVRAFRTRADECRHTRTVVSLDEVAGVLSGMSELLSFLRGARSVFADLECPGKHYIQGGTFPMFMGGKNAWDLSQVFDAPLGSTLVVKCSECSKTLASLPVVVSET